MREEGSQMWEGVKRAARASYTQGRGVREAGLIWVEAQAGGGAVNLEGDVVFNVRGEPGIGLTFLPAYQLEAEMSLEVGVQEYTDLNYMMTEGEVKTEMLCPARHGLALSPSLGLLSFYNRVEVTYHNAYTDPLENISCGSANLLVKTGALEKGFGGGGVSMDQEVEGVPWPVDPTQDPVTQFRVYRSRIPRYPFRLLAPWQQPRVAGTLGRSLDYPEAGIIPPDTDFRVLLRRETRVPDIMMLMPLKQKASLACGADKLIDSDTRSWRRYTFKDEKGKERFFEVMTVKQRLRKLSLVVKRLHFCSDPWPWPSQIHSVYRSMAVELSKATTQIHPISWDLAQPPATLFIMFLRQSEVMSGGGGIGDTASKLDKLLSTSPDLFYRPLKLEELKLMDNRSVTGEWPVESLCLHQMGKAVPDMSLRQYVDHLRYKIVIKLVISGVFLFYFF